LISSGRPIFFLQRRLGKNMNEFKIIKFRTMLTDSEFMKEGLITTMGDRRITPIGRFLREYSLDEIPQLINVLKGDMNLIGPRPPVYYELGDICEFDEKIKLRFSVKPGITGLSQVQGRNELEWKDKIRYDNFYVNKIRQGNICINFYILIKTIFIVITKKGAYENVK
jgi:lipopolysaccharide/colanic/teichoic acid biosynthesis glycosyltransferase